MKKVLRNLAISAMVLAIAAPVFAAKTPKNKDGTRDVELWYGPAVSEAGAPPSDWVAYNIIKSKLKINLKLTALPSSEADQETKVNAAGAANALPDLFMVSSKVLDILVKQKLVAPVDDMYKMMPNRTSKLYDKEAIKFSTYADGNSYALAQPGSIVRNEGVLIRKDWLDKLGLKVPVTTDDYFEVMKAFTERDPDGNGKADTFGYGAFLEVSAANNGFGRRLDPIFGAFGVAGTWNLSSVKTAGLNILKPEYYDAMVYLKKIVDAKVIDPNWLAYKKDDFRANWKQGRFGIMREQNAAYANEANYTPFDKNFPNGSWLVIEPPTGPNGQKSAGTYSQAYRMYAVSTKATRFQDKKQIIAQLLEWMSSDEGYYLLGWGVEGVNYIKNKDGVPIVEGLKDPEKAYTKPAIQPLTQLRNMVYYNGDIELASRYPTYKTPSGKTMSALTALRQMQATAWTACPGQDKMPKPDADLDRFYQQGVVEFMTGKRELTKANWDSWVAEFKAMGGADWEKAGVTLAKESGYVK